MQNLQAPNIEKVLLMIKALNRKTLLLWLLIFNFSIIYEQFCFKLLRIVLIISLILV
jgi:hypothetical protein